MDYKIWYKNISNEIELSLLNASRISMKRIFHSEECVPSKICPLKVKNFYTSIKAFGPYYSVTLQIFELAKFLAKVLIIYLLIT